MSCDFVLFLCFIVFCCINRQTTLRYIQINLQTVIWKIHQLRLRVLWSIFLDVLWIVILKSMVPKYIEMAICMGTYLLFTLKLKYFMYVRLWNILFNLFLSNLRLGSQSNQIQRWNSYLFRGHTISKRLSFSGKCHRWRFSGKNICKISFKMWKPSFSK